MDQTHSQFAFALCQPGSEARLKKEILQLRPTLKPAFQRPGLVTFKAPSTDVKPNDAPASLFARAWGCSGGPAKTLEEVRAIQARVGAAHIFVGPRDPEIAVPAQWMELSTPNKPNTNDLVLDVVVHPDEPALVGWHTHGASRHKTPSGLFTYHVPEEAPSRAYRKGVEGILWSEARIQKGDILLEIGASPGGASLAYVEHGLRVIAVDTQPLSPLIQAHPGLIRWIQRSIGDILLEELPPAVHWIALDANIAPQHAVRSLKRLIQHYKKSLRGMLLTLKLNDDAAIASIPKLLQELRVGALRVDATQLAANRGDIFVSVVSQ
jgi:23S rRNA (cytidine2498-2'-O)-methyltransferase